MSLSIRQKPAAASNYNRGRNAVIDMVVMHVEEGTEAGTTATFADPARHASAHFGVAKDGSVDQFVREGDTAWHAGNALINRRSLGIELEGYSATLAAPAAQMASAVELVADLCMRYTIPVDRAHIIGHSEVPDPLNPALRGGSNHHTDPGPNFDLDAFVAAVANLINTPQPPSVA